MANTSATITFNQDLAVGANLGLSILLSSNSFGVPTVSDNVFTWVNAITEARQVELGSPTAIAGEVSAINFVTAFNLAILGYAVSRSNNIVTIIADANSVAYGSTEFYSPVNYIDVLTGELVTVANDPSLGIVIYNAPPASLFSFLPENMSFVHVKNDPLPSKIITISGDLWKIVAKPNFILSSLFPEVVITSVTDISGTYFVASGSGTAEVLVSLSNYYDGDVMFSDSDLTGSFSVFENDILKGNIGYAISVIRLSDFLSNPFSPGKLYFTQQLDYLAFNSETPGTYIDFNIEIKVFKINTYEPIIYNRPYKFPLFRGKGDFHIGSIVHELFEEIQDLADFVPNLKSNYSKTQYRPAEITVSFQEKTFGATVPGLVRSTIPMFKMAKGHKPFTTENQLALLTVSQQEVTRITPNSFVGTSFVYFGTPRIIVKKNNVVIDDFEITEADTDKVIFSYFRFVNDVKPGDSLDIIIVNGLETRSQRFLVFQKGMESTYFFFENDNQILEPYEFSGRRRVNSTLKNNTTTKFKNLYSFDSKVKSTIGQSFIVNTGNLTKTDHRIITAIMASTKVWCSFDNPEGPYFRVDATTSKINNQDTSSSEENFDIEFNILENANASIYPR